MSRHGGRIWGVVSRLWVHALESLENISLTCFRDFDCNPPGRGQGSLVWGTYPDHLFQMVGQMLVSRTCDRSQQKHSVLMHD